MDIHAVLEQAQFEFEIRDRWTAVLDRRPEFVKTFGTTRIGKIQNAHLYITPAALVNAVEVLIRGSGHSIDYLRSGDPARSHSYPGVGLDELSEDELTKFISYLRNSIDSHISANKRLG